MLNVKQGSYECHFSSLLVVQLNKEIKPWFSCLLGIVLFLYKVIVEDFPIRLY